jgi:hypothetical protein
MDGENWEIAMGLLLVIIAVVLPIVAGSLFWPWWIVLVCASLGFLGFFEANSGRIEILGGSGGVPRVIASALALNTVVCGVLFELGHLLRHL